MPTKPLPAHPSIEHLKHQAKNLLRAHRTPDVCQRLREFHPRFRTLGDAEIAGTPLSLADAQLTIAREHGFSSWPRLKQHLTGPRREDLSLPYRDRISDPAFRAAVDLLDAGDAEGLRRHLRAHPTLARQRETFEGGNYFHNPTLLEFIAENPSRRGRVPRNAAEIARIVLDAGAANDRAALDEALGLVASSRVARESGVQRSLIGVLCDAGANPNAGALAALLYGEFDGVRALLDRGATMTLPIAAGFGFEDDARTALGAADDEERQLALALAAQHGHGAIVRLFLETGVDPDRYSPPGSHSHATPLHQAALAGHLDIVRILVEHGARTDMQDIHYGGTPLGWAEYAGHRDVAQYLRAAWSE